MSTMLRPQYSYAPTSLSPTVLWEGRITRDGNYRSRYFRVSLCGTDNREEDHDFRNLDGVAVEEAFFDSHGQKTWEPVVQTEELLHILTFVVSKPHLFRNPLKP